MISHAKALARPMLSPCIAAMHMNLVCHLVQYLSRRE
jgi:hypothetical protein